LTYYANNGFATGTKELGGHQLKVLEIDTCKWWKRLTNVVFLMNETTGAKVQNLFPCR
jgi:hypothetical protein